MMNAAQKRKVEKICQRVRKDFNIIGRAFTKEDFYRICKTEKITLATPERLPNSELLSFPNLKGFYAWGRGEYKVIWLRSLYKKKFDRFVAAHELGHHFCEHSLGLKTTQVGLIRDELSEAQADYFAKLLLQKGGIYDEPKTF